MNRANRYPFGRIAIFALLLCMIVVVIESALAYPIQEYGLGFGFQRIQGEMLQVAVQKDVARSERKAAGVYRDYFIPDVAFEYRVDGVRFVGRQVRVFGPTRYAHWEIERMLFRYRAGKHVDVYYRPGRPDFALLETTFPWSYVWSAAIGALMYFPFGYGLCFALWNRWTAK